MDTLVERKTRFVVLSRVDGFTLACSMAARQELEWMTPEEALSKGMTEHDLLIQLDQRVSPDNHDLEASCTVIGCDCDYGAPASALIRVIEKKVPDVVIRALEDPQVEAGEVVSQCRDRSS